MKNAEFQKTIAAYLNKSNLNGMIPSFIRYGQELLEDDLRLESMIAVVANDLATGAESFLEPALFIEMISVRVMTDTETPERYEPLVKMDWLTFVANKYPLADANRPYYYTRMNVVETTDGELPDTGITAVTARSFLFERATAEDYIIETAFYRKETQLTTDSSSNWWLANAEKAFLYASLVEASLYLASDDPRIKVWAAGYEQAKSDLERKDNRARDGGSGVRRNKLHL